MHKFAKKSRPISLYLWDSVGGKGKTEWARSLGKHIYLCGTIDCRSWPKDITEIQYLILDDIDIDHLKKAMMWKGFMSGQKVMTLRDLHYKRQIQFGLPTICLSNVPLLGDAWDDEHIKVIELDQPLSTKLLKLTSAELRKDMKLLKRDDGTYYIG